MSPDLVTGWHRHPYHQLEYALAGVAEVQTRHGRYLLPPQQAMWIPAHVEHDTTLRGVRSVSVFLHPDVIRTDTEHAAVLAVSPLLREMMLEATRWPIQRRNKSDAMATSFFDTLARLVAEALRDDLPLWLPVAGDPVVAEVLERTTADSRQRSSRPSAPRSACPSARCAVASAPDLGMNWSDYVLQARLMRAVALLASSEQSVVDIASNVGFGSPSGFTRAFRASLGTTPSEYRRDVDRADGRRRTSGLDHRLPHVCRQRTPGRRSAPDRRSTAMEPEERVGASDRSGSIAGFERERVTGFGGVDIDCLVGGHGPPLLLLHGYPQTRMAFKAIAPSLAERFTLVIPDLRGYGRSDKPPGEPSHESYSKRTMALDQIATMHTFGHDRFAVAGHDRGGRVAYRLALDHPDVISALALLDIVPTGEMWRSANAAAAMTAYHWFFLAQPEPLPENLLSSDPEFFVRWTLQSWAADGFSFDPESLADYISCFSEPGCIHATCEDYRAGWSIDRVLDDADQGQRKIVAPTLVLWGSEYSVSRSRPLATWERWAHDVRGESVPGGHFICEESPHETSAALSEFLEIHVD